MNGPGEYRSTYVALWSDDDYLALPPLAKILFHYLRDHLPATGIGRVSEHRAASDIGCSREQIAEMLQILCFPKAGKKRGWIVMESGAVWIVNALRFDPNLKPSNTAKHVPFVRKKLTQAEAPESLKREFRRYYSMWFPPEKAEESGSDRLSIGYPYPTDRLPIQVAVAVTRDKSIKAYVLSGESDESENGTDPFTIQPACSCDDLPSTTPDMTDPQNLPLPKADEHRTAESGIEPRDPAKWVHAEYPPEFEELWALYPKRRGTNSKANAHKQWLARQKSGVPHEQMVAGVERYAAFCADEFGAAPSPYVMGAERFLGKGAHYDEAWAFTPSTAPATNGNGHHNGNGKLDAAKMRSIIAAHELSRWDGNMADYQGRIEAACPAGMDHGAWRSLVMKVQPTDLRSFTFEPSLLKEIERRMALP